MATTERAGLEGDLQAKRSEGTPAPSPRPTFDHATPIPYASARLHLWGNDDAGQVPDWIYVSSEKIHHLVFALPPGARFTHSDGFRTVFAADELLYVLSGTMVIADPEHGEVRRVERGEAVFFRRDTWHHAVSFGTEQLRVLEFFAPPPSTGASSAYARTKELLTDIRYRMSVRSSFVRAYALEAPVDGGGAKNSSTRSCSVPKLTAWCHVSRRKNTASPRSTRRTSPCSGSAITIVPESTYRSSSAANTVRNPSEWVNLAPGGSAKTR